MKLADTIKLNLLRYAATSGYDIVIPNFFRDGYEMDVFKLTAAGQVWEYEIKVSRADFFADAKKKLRWADNKHSIIRAGKRCNRFYFVVPRGLISVEECPDFAGLIYCIGSDPAEVVKVAPLHKYQSNLDYRSLCKSLAFRENNIQGKLRYEKHRIKKAQQMLDALKSKYPNELLLLQSI